MFYRYRKHTMFRRGALVAALFAPWLMGANVNHWQPPLNATGLLQVDHGQPWQKGLYSVNLWLDYAYRPLVYRFADSSYDPVINQQLSLDASFSYSILDWLDVGVGLPIVLRQGGAAPPSAVEGLSDPSGTGLGDLRLSSRMLLLPARVWGGDLSFKLDLFLPTGSSRLQSGSGNVAFRPQILASYKLLPKLTLFASVGYLWQEDQDLYTTAYGDYFEAHLGGRWALTEAYAPWHMMVEFVGRTSREHGLSTNLTALETFVGVGHRFAQLWDVVVGGSFGTGRQVGTPLARALVGVSYRPETHDRDGDGIPDQADKCPDKAETFNTYEDEDGCPDQVPVQAPESDFGDRDNDGVPDSHDKCPDTPEDLDGFADDDGCPDPDNDHDGIPDAQDACPNAPETINGINDQDGCPDVGESAVAVSDKGIVLLKMVQFETGKADLLKTSNSILDQVASTLEAHPEITRVQVEGHTDNRGKAALNLRLSQSRAERVRQYLIQHGVEGKRLVARGFGITQPIADNATPEGRYNNRRVAFTILERAP